MPNRASLTDFELMVLLAVLRVGDDAYGVPIAREVEQTTGRTVAVGAVYAALQRLESRRLVSAAMGEPTAMRGGRAKRYFRVTAKGIKAAREAQRVFVTLWRGIPQLEGGGA